MMTLPKIVPGPLQIFLFKLVVIWADQLWARIYCARRCQLGDRYPSRCERRAKSEALAYSIRTFICTWFWRCPSFFTLPAVRPCTRWQGWMLLFRKIVINCLVFIDIRQPVLYNVSRIFSAPCARCLVVPFIIADLYLLFWLENI